MASGARAEATELSESRLRTRSGSLFPNWLLRQGQEDQVCGGDLALLLAHQGF